jgi:hypothetical protein
MRELNQRRNMMNQISRITLKILRKGRFSGVAALVGLGLLLTVSGAKAGSALPSNPGAAPAIPFVSPHGDDHQREDSNGPASIVGLWHVIFTATSNDNFPPGVSPQPQPPFQFVETLKTWHADGTEFENAFLPPGGGNVCFGVWKELSKDTVKLHHTGLMFNPDGSLSAIFTVDETDTVSSNGKSYKGVFDFKLWPPSYEAVGVGAPISEVQGTTLASRVTVD